MGTVGVEGGEGGDLLRQHGEVVQDARHFESGHPGGDIENLTHHRGRFEHRQHTRGRRECIGGNRCQRG